VGDIDAFLAAARESPEDDTRRLVFADWLEEQADAALRAWGEFIRVQVMAARQPTPAARRETLARAWELLLAYRDQWPHAEGLAGYELVRGLPVTECGCLRPDAIEPGEPDEIGDFLPRPGQLSNIRVVIGLTRVELAVGAPYELDILRRARCAACDVSRRPSCPTCRGEGVALATERLVLGVPPDLPDGLQLRFRGQGSTILRDMLPGDLICQVRVTDPPPEPPPPPPTLWQRLWALTRRRVGGSS
jgi:uncharacterized protein (TIGR02996 family)